MTKEEVLQKVNDYCTEKQYTSSTLTDSFKDKFADHFQKADPEGNIEDESVQKALKFALNTAFSSASEMAAFKTSEYTTKENEYKRQLEELRNKQKPPKQEEVVLPKEVTEQLEELKKFKDAHAKQEKKTNIINIAKDGIRQDLHASFDKFVSDYDVQIDKEDKEQAESLVLKFQDIFKDSIGDIKPRTPVQTKKQDEEFLSSIPVIKVC